MKSSTERSHGRYCPTCEMFHEWKELDWQVIGPAGKQVWEWSCPWCHRLLGSTPFSPPPDLPEPLPDQGKRSRRDLSPHSGRNDGTTPEGDVSIRITPLDEQGHPRSTGIHSL